MKTRFEDDSYIKVDKYIAHHQAHGKVAMSKMQTSHLIRYYAMLLKNPTTVFSMIVDDIEEQHATVPDILPRTYKDYIIFIRATPLVQALEIELEERGVSATALRTINLELRNNKYED